MNLHRNETTNTDRQASLLNPAKRSQFFTVFGLLLLGAVISLILIHVVNRQSFHWSMDWSIPWLGLAAFSATLLLLAVATTVVAAREAMSEDAVRAVKDDW